MNLNNIYFINGTAYAGKSTMVQRLAEKYDGIACTENYHEQLMDESLDPKEFPGLCYTRDLQDWHDFVRRTPDEYEAWIDETSRECEILELRILDKVSEQGKKVFVDTNVSLETLHRFYDPKEAGDTVSSNHVLIMLADPEISVRRFFERPDREKQFLYRLMLEEPDPEKSLANFRECLKRINSRECYEKFLHAGFPVILRDENRTIEETLVLAEKAFGLTDPLKAEEADEKIFYHVISDIPKQAGQHILLDEEHPNGVHRRVYAELEMVRDIYAHPDQYDEKNLSHTVSVALRELALEKVRKEKYPQYPSRMASLYVSRSFKEAEQWADYFASLGRPVYGIAKIRVNGGCYEGDAYKCFDGSVYEEENLRRAEIYWQNGPNSDGREKIVEILAGGDIEVVEIVREMNANIPSEQEG